MATVSSKSGGKEEPALGTPIRCTKGGYSDDHNRFGRVINIVKDLNRTPQGDHFEHWNGKIAVRFSDGDVILDRDEWELWESD